MAFLSDLYKECHDVVKNLSSQFGKVKFNKSLCRLLTNKYTASLTYLDNYIFREDGSIDLPCKTALVELRRIISCGERLVTQWTRKDWWMSVITSSDSASLDKKVILHLREFLACVNVLVQMKTNMTYGPALGPTLDSLDSSVQQACRRDIQDLILSTKQHGRGKIFTSKFAKLAKHLSEKLEAEISNHEHPYTIDFPLDVEMFYKDRLGEGSFGTVYKCTFLGVMAAAKVWKTNRIKKEAPEKEASLFSKLRHPNVAQFIGYGVMENQPVIISELMSTDLRRYLDEKKENAGEGPPLPMLVAMNILLQIAEAMNYLHENEVMHRDLKASNVLINIVEGPDGQLSSSSVQVKLTDFGESKLKLCDSGYTTPMVGTTRWRAPEVFELDENREKYTKSADVYSFSMLCFEVLTGDVPFKDKPLGTLLQSIRDGVRPQLPHADYCPDYLSALIEKCWATNAVERPQFPTICQLLVHYKARVLYPFTEGLTSRNLSVLQQLQSLSVDRPYSKFSFTELKAATASFSPKGSLVTSTWSRLKEGDRVILDSGCEAAMDLLKSKEKEDVERRLRELQLSKGYDHTMNPLGGLTSSILEAQDSTFPKPMFYGECSKVPVPSSGDNRSNVQCPLRQDAMSLYQAIVLRKREDLSIQINHLTEHVNNFLVKSSQHQVPRIVLFTTDDASMKQTLITNLVPGMKAIQLHLLCEYRTQVHIVEGQRGCEVILEGKQWEKIHGLVVEGLKWVFLAMKVGAHITMGIGDLVPNPSKAYAKAVSDSVGSCLPMDWATVTPQELVMDAASAMRTAQKECAEQWLVDFLKDKSILKEFGLQRVIYKDEQTAEAGWICEEHLKKGEQTGELARLPHRRIFF